MSEIDINQVLSQMRSLAAQAQGSGSNAAQVGEVTSGDSVNFSEMLKTSVNQVNDVLKEAGDLAEKFEAGDPDVNLTQVMIALQKASVSFQGMTQVRNKLVSAYQDVMNMPI